MILQQTDQRVYTFSHWNRRKYIFFFIIYLFIFWHFQVFMNNIYTKYLFDIWATTWQNVSSGVSDQVRLKLA